jgi:hypothetical protein
MFTCGTLLQATTFKDNSLLYQAKVCSRAEHGLGSRFGQRSIILRSTHSTHWNMDLFLLCRSVSTEIKQRAMLYTSAPGQCWLPRLYMQEASVMVLFIVPQKLRRALIEGLSSVSRQTCPKYDGDGHLDLKWFNHPPRDRQILATLKGHQAERDQSAWIWAKRFYRGIELGNGSPKIWDTSQWYTKQERSTTSSRASAIYISWTLRAQVILG